MSNFVRIVADQNCFSIWGSRSHKLSSIYPVKDHEEPIHSWWADAENFRKSEAYGAPQPEYFCNPSTVSTPLKAIQASI